MTLKKVHLNKAIAEETNPEAHKTTTLSHHALIIALVSPGLIAGRLVGFIR